MTKTHIILAVLVLTLAACTSQQNLESPYVGEETRDIKYLSEADVEGLQAGIGTPLGGLAKPAELNGLPGPRHVLDAADALDITPQQEESIQFIYDEMNTDAKLLGADLIAIEQEIDDGLSSGMITEEQLEVLLNESAEIYGQLRYVHLVAHLQTADILSQSQIDAYNTLRGYDKADPCENVPEGHPPEMWKLHHNCP